MEEGRNVNGRYDTACMYSGPMVVNSASVTFLKIYVTMVVNGILVSVVTPEQTQKDAHSIC